MYISTVKKKKNGSELQRCNKNIETYCMLQSGLRPVTQGL